MVMFWTMLRSSQLLAILVTSALLPTAMAQLREDIQFEASSVKMPFPVSDIMANYMQGNNGDEDGFIIITGGCNSPKGNERLTFDDGTQDLFACLSTTNRTFRFDPFTNFFQEMAEAPHERQRHAAVVVDKELYLIGGRDSNDDLVAAIDSFDPKTNTWTTRGELPQDVVTSDLTAWAWKNYIYVTGGFEANYTSVGTTYRLNVANDPGDFESMSQEVLTSSDHPRGDIHAIEHFGYAYMAGGLTHASFWCEGLKTTERYHMETDTWEVLDDLNLGRADMAVALLNGKIVAMGGESKPDDCLDVSDPAYGSFPVDHVDVLLDPETNGAAAEWVEFEKFHDQRFRFAAAVVPAQSRLYTFGGQLPFDFTCDCFPTSDLVGIGTEVFKQDEGGDTSSEDGAKIAAIVLGCFVGVGFLVLVTTKIMKKQSKESMEQGSPVEFQAKEEGAFVQ